MHSVMTGFVYVCEGFHAKQRYFIYIFRSNAKVFHFFFSKFQLNADFYMEFE